MKAAAFTIISKNYLPYARVLMSSLRTWAPELRRIVVLVDQPEGYFDPASEDFDIILSRDLPIPGAEWFHFKYTILELNTAVKPYAAEAIFERYQIDRLLYLDPDICVYSGLEPLLAAMDAHAIVLTPHLTAPLEDARRPTEVDVLRSGSYNLGFLGLKRCDESSRFLTWWQSRLHEHCVVDLAKGFFVDQRWVDLVPGMFSDVGILRDPGLNVAYWNIQHRVVTGIAGKFQVNGVPLCFFHFSGLDPDNPQALSRHQDRFTLEDLGDTRHVVLEYRDRLLDAGYSECRSWPYFYGQFASGFPIPDLGRPAHHECPDLLTRVSHPFSEEGRIAFLDMWNQFLDVPDHNPSGITRLSYRMYQARTDVQIEMPDLFETDRIRFLEWVVRGGASEHHLHDAFVEPIRATLQALEVAARAAEELLAEAAVEQVNEVVEVEEPTDEVTDPVVEVEDAAGEMTDAIGEVIDPGMSVEQALLEIESLNQPVDGAVRLTRLSIAIHESRADLQECFPDAHDVRYLEWLLTYGAYEYRLPAPLLSPIRAEWNRVLGTFASSSERLRRRLSAVRASAGLTLNSGLTELVAAVTQARTGPALRLPAVRPAEPPRLGDGVNLVGYTRSEMGVGESVRSAIRAAHAIGLQCGVKSIDEAGPYRLEDRSVPQTDDACDHRINIFHVNADQSQYVLHRLGDAFTSDRYNIGYWAWELEEFPDRWVGAFDSFNEIWTPSTFCQQAIGRKSTIPVIRMPHAIHLERSAPADRLALGIPDDAFVFLAAFDLLSIFERKNPLGVIDAFKCAFSGSPEYWLVLKVNHAEHRRQEMLRIHEAASGLPVVIIDRTIDRSDLTGLFEMADCFVSLHRSEGFGLAIAEAMFLSKPVVVTGYSGNVDFTSPDSAFLVDYRLVEVPAGCAPYDEGALWAEPERDSAVAAMRRVATDPAAREDRARNGRDYAHTHLSPAAVGKLMAERLSELPQRPAITRI